jgi:hypothetical protein
MGWEWAVRWYGGWVLFCSPWDLHPFLHLHLLPIFFHPSPPTPISLPGTHEWAPVPHTFSTDNGNGLDGDSNSDIASKPYVTTAHENSLEKP